MPPSLKGDIDLQWRTILYERTTRRRRDGVALGGIVRFNRFNHRLHRSSLPKSNSRPGVINANSFERDNRQQLG